jgi:hypothetical protein
VIVRVSVGVEVDVRVGVEVLVGVDVGCWMTIVPSVVLPKTEEPSE